MISDSNIFYKVVYRRVQGETRFLMATTSIIVRFRCMCQRKKIS